MARLIDTIEEITLDFGERFSDSGFQPPVRCTERLGKMIISAALGSGVRYETAVHIADMLPSRPSEYQIEAAASRHRFPNQTKMRLFSIFADESKLLKIAIDWLRSPANVRDDRKSMADLVPGLGPKQSSFLFSIAGYGQNIAVLDRHILRYLHLLGILPNLAFPTNWNNYEAVEGTFLEYASNHNLPADALDVAIWITMKAAGREVVPCVQ